MSEQKKKNNVVVLVIIIILVVAIGGYAIWQSQSKTNSGSSENTVTTTTTQATTTTENQEVKFTNNEITVKVGDTNTLLVNAPENSELKWSSSDTSVVTVENGNIKGIAKGTATITVQLGNSVDTCTVTVKEKKKTAKSYPEYLGTWYGGTTYKGEYDLYNYELVITTYTDKRIKGEITSSSQGQTSNQSFDVKNENNKCSINMKDSAFGNHTITLKFTSSSVYINDGEGEGYLYK